MSIVLALIDQAATVYCVGAGALNHVFCDELGMCSNEHPHKAINDWRTLESVCAED